MRIIHSVRIGRSIPRQVGQNFLSRPIRQDGSANTDAGEEM